MQHARAVLLVGGGEVAPSTMSLAREAAGVVVAADGGADRLGAFGLRPDAVIGDMDSVADPRPWRDRLGPMFLKVAEQDSTDFEKCLTRIAAPVILAVGFTGARMDHTLAAFAAVAADRPGRVILLSGEDVILHLPRPWRVSPGRGVRFSLFPMATVGGLASGGLRWPIRGLEFSPTGMIGVSNQTTEDDVFVEVDRPGMLAILPVDRLRAVLDSLPDLRALT